MSFESCSHCHSIAFKPQVNITNTVYEHLRCAHALPENLLSDASALIQSVEKDLDGYESEMHRLQIRMTNVRNRRERLKTHAENLRSLFSPIRKLPNELLARVFSYVCIENDLMYGQGGSAVTLGSVCLRWRQLTLACPELWANIKVQLPDDGDLDDGAGGRTTALVALYLQRSKTHPLGLSFLGIPWRYDNDEYVDHAVYKEIAQHSSRWKDVSFSAPMISLGLYPAFYPLDLPMLDTLTYDSEGDSDCSLEMLEKVPMLRAFHASGMRFYWKEGLGSLLPARQTTLSDVEYALNIGNFYEMLDNCPNLSRLSVVNYNTKDENEDIRATPPRILPKLHTLSLRFSTIIGENDEDNFLTSVLTSLTTPRLTNLSLEQIEEQEELTPFHAIHSFLTRSSCSLQALSLKNVAVTDRELVAILKHCVTLEALHIVDPFPPNPAITKAFIESLHSSKRSAIQTSPLPIAKSLRSLTLDVQYMIEFEADAFVDMVSSRWIPNPAMAEAFGISCLRSVELFLHEETKVDREAYQPLLPFEKAGMMIVVKKGEEYVF